MGRTILSAEGLAMKMLMKGRRHRVGRRKTWLLYPISKRQLQRRAPEADAEGRPASCRLMHGSLPGSKAFLQLVPLPQLRPRSGLGCSDSHKALFPPEYGISIGRISVVVDAGARGIRS